VEPCCDNVNNNIDQNCGSECHFAGESIKQKHAYSNVNTLNVDVINIATNHHNDSGNNNINNRYAHFSERY
jgi:hypothetical protein